MELCDSANIIEKLNKEFDDLQNLNQKLVEEVELKAETIKEQQVELEVMSLWIRYNKIDHFPDMLSFWYDYGESLHKLDVPINYNPEYDKVFSEWYPLYGTGFDEGDLPSIPNLLRRQYRDYENNFEDYVFKELVENY